jgi:hypothetical protein
MADVQTHGLNELVDLFANAFIPVSTERKMQQAVEDLLTESGVDYKRERKIGVRDRIDFLCDRIGIETKVSDSYIEVACQLLRYAESPDIDSIILVTNKATHRQLDGLANEKNIPIRVVFVAFNGF